MSNTMRIGIVGAAQVATYAMLAPARVLDRVEVTAVAARDPERARAYAAEHGIPRAIDSYAALIDDPDIDLVYVATTNDTHAAHALAAIAASKPVLVEKPFALDSAEAQIVLDAARASGTRVFEAMHSLHHPAVAYVQGILARNELGDIRRVDAEFSVPGPADDAAFRWHAAYGGGALMDLGVYPLAWFRALFGEAFDVLGASAEWRNDVDAATQATLRFANGVEASLRSSMNVERPVSRLVIEGARGRVDFLSFVHPQFGPGVTLVRDGVEHLETFGAGTTSFGEQLAHVRDTVLDGAPFPLAENDFVRSMQAIEKVKAAIGPAGASSGPGGSVRPG
jgi:predicted dehydrogenase